MRYNTGRRRERSGSGKRGRVSGGDLWFVSTESWFESGALSQDEFDLMVRLVARYVAWDVDQFDHWEMPTPSGDAMYVDFHQGTTEAYSADAYRPMWPTAEPGQPAWTVWRQDDNGNRVPMLRFGNPHAARAVAHAFEERGHRQSYWVEAPPN